MRFIYSSDIHGDEEKYEKLLQVALKGNYNNIVLGGDLLPKINITYELQKGFVNGYLKEYFKKLQEKNINCLCILGNDDFEPVDKDFDNLCSSFPNVFNIDKSQHSIEDCSFIGLSTVLDHPFGRKNNVAIEKGFEIQKQLGQPQMLINGQIYFIDDWENFAKRHLRNMEDILKELPEPESGKKCIYVFHMPPQNLNLGITGRGLSVGSMAIYKFLEKKQPFMSLHGHIHESPGMSGIWQAKLGNTTVIQGGQSELYKGNCVYMTIDTEKEICERYTDKVNNRPFYR